MYKRLVLSAVATLALAAAGSAGSGHPFDGKWVLDKKASNTSSDPAPDDLRQNISTKGGGHVVIQSTFREPANAVAPLLYLGIMVSSIELNPDSSEQVTQIGPYMMTTKTTVSGGKMDTEWVAKHTSGDVVNGHWTRTLAPDGKHMILDIKESSTQHQAGNATLNFVHK